MLQNNTVPPINSLFVEKECYFQDVKVTLLENLRGPKLIKKFPALYENESSLPRLPRPATCPCNQSGKVQFKSIKYKYIPSMFCAVFHIPVISVF